MALKLERVWRKLGLLTCKLCYIIIQWLQKHKNVDIIDNKVPFYKYNVNLFCDVNARLVNH